MQTGNSKYNVDLTALLAKLQGNAEVRAEAAKWVQSLVKGVDPVADENYETGLYGAMFRVMGLDPEGDLCFDVVKVQQLGVAFGIEVVFGLVDLDYGPFKVVI